MIFKLNTQFNDIYGKQPLLFAAPGRVNLIGEHTDYNEGFVLPGAIDKCMYVAITKNDTSLLSVYASEFNEKIEMKLDELKPTKNWFTYLAGMMYLIKERGLPVGGVNVVMDGDIPVGAGMSSSAALCSSFGIALNELFCLGLSRIEIARLGQQTEHEFAGAKVGIMDQFASLHGKSGHVIKLDCRSLEHEYIPFNFPEYKIVLVNTMVKHSLASTAYNQRRHECEEGVRILKSVYPHIKSLRDLSPQQVSTNKDKLSAQVYKRCDYVVNENRRLLEGCDLLRSGKLAAFGRLMYETHEGLSKDYEVSCKEADFLVDEARKHQSVLGARMMGGGFGGCTINLVVASEVDFFTKSMQEAYQNGFSIMPEVYVTQIEEGARRIGTNL